MNSYGGIGEVFFERDHVVTCELEFFHQEGIDAVDFEIIEDRCQQLSESDWTEYRRVQQPGLSMEAAELLVIEQMLSAVVID